MNTEAIINKTTITELSAAMGSDFMIELVASYLLDAPAQIELLAKALAEGDADAFRRAAHSIKSTSLYFGAEKLAAQARALEERGREDHLDGSSTEVRKLSDLFAEVCKELKDLGYE